MLATQSQVKILNPKMLVARGLLKTNRKVAVNTVPFTWQEVQSAKRMKKWKERLEKKYDTEDIEDDYQPVTQQEFRE